ncbi:MAG: hypothetical protein QOF39_2410 [Frankiales bacterium]|nr:hypothetical protein [Frankiales bacterium]
MLWKSGPRALRNLTSLRALTGGPASLEHLEQPRSPVEDGLARRPELSEPRTITLKSKRGPSRAAPIDPADIAAVAALALTEEGHQGKEYVLTGDESFTVAEQVAILGLRTDTVRQLLGRRPRTFADWCRRNADAFAPSC